MPTQETISWNYLNIVIETQLLNIEVEMHYFYIVVYLDNDISYKLFTREMYGFSEYAS